ncbi:MAG TPA: hypothetical protein QGI72_03125, partial [Poseidonia sp.]|nr:hypothetical protein [Poseidonia sp.]
MDTGHLEERLASSAGTFRRTAPFIVVSCVILTALLLGQLVLSPPTFETDLNDFAPQSDSIEKHDAIHEFFPDEIRPMFIHVTTDEGSNVLSLESLQAMQSDLVFFKNESSKMQNIVHVWTTAPGILQLSLDEEGNGEKIAELNNWGEILDALFDENETCGLTADDQLLSAATYASSALLNKDLSIDPTCDYLESGTGDGAPTASSTLWVLEIDPEMDDKQRKVLQDQMRDIFTDRSKESIMNYEVISNDLLSHDIDEGTFDNLILLIAIAFVVVVL